ncbi:MAG: V-type ATPase subunit [Bacillota bacterium]|nr:V-type ATPase subunit [Bacillota bacterium]
MLNDYFKYGAITAKVKSMHGYSFKSSDYEALMSKRNIGEMLSFLKSTESYGFLLRDMDETAMSRIAIEAALKKDLFYKYLKLFNYIGFSQKKSIAYIILKAEADEILRYVRFIKAHKPDEYFMLKSEFLLEHSKIDFKSLQSKISFNDLQQAVKGTHYYSALSDFGSDFDYTEVEHAVYTSYYGYKLELFSNLDDAAKNQITDMIFTQIDFINISAIIRLKGYYGAGNDKETISKYLLPYSKYLKGNLLNAVLQAPDKEAVYNALRKSPYGGFFEHSDRMYVDAMIPLFLTRYCKRLFNSGTPSLGIALAYLQLQEIEIQNIINIIESVGYDLMPDVMRKYLYIS